MMTFEITKIVKEGIVILRLRGRLVIGESGLLLRNTLDALEKSCNINIILALAEMEEIDSDGTGLLLVVAGDLQRLGGSLKLVDLRRVNMDLMLLARMETTFQFFDDEQDAIDSFFPDRALPSFDVLRFVEEQRRTSQIDSDKS